MKRGDIVVNTRLMEKIYIFILMMCLNIEPIVKRQIDQRM